MRRPFSIWSRTSMNIETNLSSVVSRTTEMRTNVIQKSNQTLFGNEKGQICFPRVRHRFPCGYRMAFKKRNRGIISLMSAPSGDEKWGKRFPRVHPAPLGSKIGRKCYRRGDRISSRNRYREWRSKGRIKVVWPPSLPLGRGKKRRSYSERP
mgnify:CR=1 FL=1